MKKYPYKIGHIPLFGSVFDYAKDPLKYYENLRELNQPLVYDKLFGKYFYIVFDKNLIDEIFIKKSKNYHKNKFLKSFDDFFGEGLLTSDGEKWKNDRKVIQPSFTKQKVNQYSVRILNETNHFITSLESQNEFFVMQTMTKLTLAIFLNSVLGVTYNQEIYQSVLKTTIDCNEYLSKSSNPLGLLMAKMPTSYRRRYLKGIKEFENLIYKLIEEKKISLSKEGSSNDLLSSLIESNMLDLKNLRDQTMTFLIAGHETSAQTLSFAFYILGSREDISDKLFKSLEEKFENNEINIEQLSEVLYLDQFINEVLRLYPTSWMIGRDLIVDDTIGDYFIPKGAMVTLPIWAIHRDPNVYQNPDDFIPERWTETFIKNLHSSSFIPFGYGPRVCIGASFAMNEFRIVIAQMVLKYKFKLKENKPLEITTLIMARPKNDFIIEFIKRN